MSLAIIANSNQARLGLWALTPLAIPIKVQAHMGFSKQTLSNGTRLLVQRTPQFQSAAVAICIDGGVRDEPAMDAGLTHFVEHLVFKRTAKRSTLDIACTIDQFGGDINAFTDAESLCLHAVVPLSSLSDLLNFFAELLRDAAFSQDDFEVEREVIRQEILESLDDPGDSAYHELSRQLWPGDPLGLPTFGTLATLESFTREQALGHLRKVLTGARLCIGVAGAVDPEKILTEVERLFGDLDAGVALQRTTPKAGAGSALVERPVNQCFIALGVPWTALRDEHFYAAEVAVAILGGGVSSKLFQVLREHHGLAYDVQASTEAYADVAASKIAATVEQRNLEQTFDLIRNELRLICQKGFAESDVQRFVTSLRAHLVTKRDYVENFLWRAIESELVFGVYKDFAEIEATLLRLDHRQVTQVAQRLLNEGAWVQIIAGDVPKEGDTLPPFSLASSHR